ncbi:MAG: hypothetical protein ABIJ34_05960 [archaeon]
MQEIVCLFSGGADSTLAAALVSNKYDRVHLITYERFGFFKTENVKINFEKLKKKFGKNRFTLQFINIDHLFKKVQYENNAYFLKKYGPICMSICGLCKLAMHWRTILYCKENSVFNVCDGAVKEMSVFPAQNTAIALGPLHELYTFFGINYQNPVYDNGKKVEKDLYEMKIIPSCHHKMSKNDKQVVCSQQILFAKFVEYYLSDHTWSEYINHMHEFYVEKIDYIKNQLQDGMLLRN